MQQAVVIFIAVAVAGLGWVGMLLVLKAAAGGKARLQDRLSSEVRFKTDDRLSRPLALRQTRSGLPDALNDLPFVQHLQRKVSQGFPETLLAKFLFVQAAFGLTGALAGAVLSGGLGMAMLFGVAGGLLPVLALRSRGAKRKAQIAAQLPEALDFLARVLRSGQSFGTGLQMISDELPQPLAGEFRRCYDQHSLGQPLEDGLRDMATTLNSQDFAFFATAVVIQRQTGGDLAEVLKNISGMIRKRQRLLQTVRAKTAEGRFTGYIMVAFPCIMFVLAYVMNPEYGNVLLHTGTGHGLLMLAGGLCTLGLFLIKRITTIRV